jgi:predicted lipoprotein with Yx(FWY)xxD motif
MGFKKGRHTMISSKRSLLPLLIGSTAFAVAGFAGTLPTTHAQSYGYSPQPTAAPAAAVKSSTAPVWVKLANNKQLGNILTNAKGRTLYHFLSDTVGHSACTGSSCAPIWPALLLPKGASLKHAHLPGKLSTIKLADGTRQVTYNNWPLYRYSGDAKAGDTKGQGLFKLWFAATPKLKKLTKM